MAVARHSHGQMQAAAPPRVPDPHVAECRGRRNSGCPDWNCSLVLALVTTSVSTSAYEALAVTPPSGRCMPSSSSTPSARDPSMLT